MLNNLFHTTFLFETPADGGGGPAAGAVAQAPGQEAQPGIGTPAPGQDPSATGDAFWGLFPNVPEELRPTMEPHIKEMQGHITRVEQQLAPFKPFADAGLTPEATQGLLQFSNDFDANPLDMWLRMGELLQQAAGDGTSVLDPDIDLAHLRALAMGEDPDAVQQPDAPVVPGQEPVAIDPNVAAMQARIDQLEQELQQDRTQRTEATQDALLKSRMDHMRTQLTEAGWPEEGLTDQALQARIILTRGDVDAAIQGMVDERTSLLKGFTDTRETESGLTLGDQGLPRAAGGDVKPRDKDNPFAQANKGAQSFLRRQNKSTAQNG